MGADEEGTLARLNAHRREFLEPNIAEHRGQIVKRTGDGVLIEFVSAVDAVRCAIEQQRGMAERNVGMAPDKRIELRIGIHLGDIIIEDGDIFGDGVNIAARLENIAQPGGICISDDAYRQVRDKLDVNFQDSGEQELKNIARPVRVYQLRPDASTGAKPSAGLPLPDKPSIAVLAFQNMSGDIEQEFFADGVAEEDHHRVVQIALAVCYRSQLVVHLQGQIRLRAAGRPRARRAIRARRQRAQGRKPRTSHGTAHRRHHRSPCLG